MTRRLPPSRRNRQSAAALPMRLLVLVAWTLSRTAAAAVATVTEMLAGGWRMYRALCATRRVPCVRRGCRGRTSLPTWHMMHAWHAAAAASVDGSASSESNPFASCCGTLARTATAKQQHRHVNGALAPCPWVVLHYG